MYKLAIFSWQDQLDHFNDCLRTERQLKLTMKRIIAKKSSSVIAKQTAKGVLNDIRQREQELIDQRDYAQAAVSSERGTRSTAITEVIATAIPKGGVL